MRAAALIALVIFCALSSRADTALEQAQRDVIVKWRTLSTALDAANQLPDFGSRIERVTPALPADPRTDDGLARITTIRMTATQYVADLVEALRGNPQVEYAEPRPIRYLHGFEGNTHRRHDQLDGTPDDPYFDAQWGLRQIEAENAWNITRGDPNVVIAVIDLGVWFGHPDLTGQNWVNAAEANGASGVDDDGNGFVDDITGYDFVSGDGDPTPDPLEPLESHGTHVAGIAAAKRNNAQGGCGIAPECRIMAVRAGTEGRIAYGYEGVYYAARNGANVINCSWGGGGESAYENDILNYAFAQGSIVVASAGNSGSVDPIFPAGIEGVVSVAATGLSDHAAGFTQHGPWVKVSAPGVDIISSTIGDNGTPAYYSYQGTSMSAPFVAGVCALVASRFPGMGARAIIARVASSCDPIDSANPDYAGTLGFGRINAWRALVDSVQGLQFAGLTYTEVSGNGNGHIEPGETAELRVAVYNPLAPVTGVFGQLSSTDDSVIVNSTPSPYGDLPVGGPFWNNNPAFRIELPIESAPNRVLPVAIDWYGQGQRLLGRATQLVLLDSTFVAVNNGRLSLGFAENGSLGYADYERGYYLGPGLHIEPRPSNGLYHGSFLLGNAGIVSDNAYGDGGRNTFEWVAMPDSFAHMVPGTRSDLEARAAFEDMQAQQMLFARVEAAALAWTDPQANGFIVLEYRILNRSVNAWNAAYAGFFFDWDLGSASSNLSHFDSTSGVSYVSQTVPGHPLVGAVALNDRWDGYRVIDNNLIGDTTQWTDAYKWQAMTGGIDPSPTLPMDLSQIVSVGPFTVGAQDSFTVAFALVVGQTLDELRANAAAASAHYEARYVSPPPSEVKPAVGLYPNPATRGSTLSLILPTSSRATVRFYNILGRLVAEIPVSSSPAGSAKFSTDALQGATGLLFYRIESAAGTTSGKILILK